MTTQTPIQVASSVAVDTLKSLLPTIIVASAPSMNPTTLALLTLLPAFVQAAETMKAAGNASPEQLATMFATVSASVQSEHDEFLARQAARAATVPSTVAHQAA